MDPKTIEAMSALGVDITTEVPTQVPSPEDAAKAVEELKNKQADGTPEWWVEVKDSTETKDPEPTEPTEPKAWDNVVVWNDEGKKPDSEPEDKEPKISNDQNPDLKTEAREDPRVEINSDDDLDGILKTLEWLTEESLDNKSDEPPSKTETQIKEKIREAKTQGDDPKKQSKTIQEVVDLNVKLQQELAVANTDSRLRKEKLDKVQEELSAIKLDDSRMVVPEELKSVNKYLKKFRETSNETFKIRAVQDAIDLIENLTGKPLRWNYVDDFIEDDLKGIETMTKKQANEIARWEEADKDPRLSRAEVHWVSI